MDMKMRKFTKISKYQYVIFRIFRIEDKVIAENFHECNQNFQTVMKVSVSQMKTDAL